MNILPYINLGCGTKYNKEWINLDFFPDSPYVQSCDLTKRIPFDDNTFEIVYHSHVLEDLERAAAQKFIDECYRILKPNGVIRIVTPNLEDIVKTYLQFLEKNLDAPTEITKANYEWILLELFDQAVRNDWGGEMAKFLQRSGVINEQFVIDRIGYIARLIRGDCSQQSEESKIDTIQERGKRILSLLKKVIQKRKRIPGIMRNTFFLSLLPQKEREYMRIGRYRKSGEVHYWLYDRYSLAVLLRNSGFKDIILMNPYGSNIPEWGKYELDVKNEEIYDPTSLFMEARK